MWIVHDYDRRYSERSPLAHLSGRAICLIAGQAALGKHLPGKSHGLLDGDEAGIGHHVHDRLDDLRRFAPTLSAACTWTFSGAASAAVPFAVSAATVASSRVFRSRFGRAKTPP